jgi:quinol monooxygenase YgiN
MIGLVARLKVKPGFEEAVAEACLKMAKAVQENEPECLLYEPYVPAGNPSEIVFLEKYTGPEALDYHRNTAHYQALVAEIGSALEGPPAVTILNPLGSGLDM